jgi:Fe-S-cluster containining protein
MAKSEKIKTKVKEFSCKQCGCCCLKYGHELPATKKDLRLWREKNRQDIIARAKIVTVGDNKIVAIDLWFSPKTGNQVWRCPWLQINRRQKKYICRIYDVRPEVCREYPVSKNKALKDGCSGYKS